MLKMKPHLTLSNNLTEHQVPEDEILHCDYSSSESSCTSLNEHDQDGYQHAGFQYPVDNLGASWGSYLQSGPPTRSGLGGGQRRVMVDIKANQLERGVVSKSPVKRTVTLMAPGSPVATIIPTQDVAQPKHFIGAKKDLTQIAEETGSLEELDSGVRGTDLHSDVHTSVTHKRDSLLTKVQSLMELVTKSKETIAKCGIHTDQLNTLTERTLRSYSDLAQLVKSRVINDDGAEVLSPGILCEITNYLTEVLTTLVKQSEKIQEEASFVQKSGKQLNRTQEQFFQEQNELQQAVEEARTQLVIEKQAFDVEKAALKANKDELRRMHCKVEEMITQTEQRQKQLLKGTVMQKSVHEVMQGRNQLVAFVQTQKEQNKLEKMLLRQQRDIQQIQRELRNIKTEVLSTQDHASRLEHRVATYRSKASLLPSQTVDEHTMKVHQSKVKTGKGGETGGFPSINGLLTAQKALDREICRMKRHLEEQQVREKHIAKEIETGYQTFKKIKIRLKQQEAAMKGRYDHRDTFPQTKNENTQKNHPHHRQPQSQSVSSPKPAPRQEARQRKPMTKKRLPKYAFSRTELVTLACFSDEETADSVLDWLGLQGHLAD